MRHAGDEATESRELFRGDEALLRLAQVVERLLRAILRRPQLVLRLALGNGIFAKHRDCARHFADFVAGMRSLNGLVVFFGDDAVHRGHDFFKRENDAAGDQRADNHDQRQENHRHESHVLIDVGQRMIEASLRLQFAQRHLGGELVDHRDHGGLVVVDCGFQQVGPHRELLGQRLQAVAERGGALGQRGQGRALQAVLREIDHHRDGLLHGGDVPARLVGGIRSQR